MWEDGELFWERRPAYDGFKSGMDTTTPVKRSVPLPVAGMTPVARLRMPVLEQRGSEMGRTPRSLYDSDGFLNT